MKNEISYEDKLELDSIIAETESITRQIYRWEMYTPSIGEIFEQLLQNLKAFKFSKVLICAEKIIKNIPENDGYYKYQTIKDEIETLSELIKKIELLSRDLIKKGFDNYKEEEIQLSEKDKLKLQKQKIDFRLKEIQEEQSPYLNLSLSIVFILMSIIFIFIPNYFNSSVFLYHICGLMFLLGLLLLKNEIELRSNVGFVTKSDKITTKRAYVFLIQSIVYMIPLTVLSIFFYELLLIRILLFIQIWFCVVLLLNGILILIAYSYQNKKVEKSGVGGFVLGTITVIGFVIQILQLFKVL